MKNLTTHYRQLILGHRFLYTILLVVFMAIFALGLQAAGGSSLDIRAGEVAQYSVVSGSAGNPVLYLVTYRAVYRYSENQGSTTPIYTLPDSPDVYIVRGYDKTIHSPFFGVMHALILQLSDNSLVYFNFSGGGIQTMTPADTTAYARVISIAGDALYQLDFSGGRYYVFESSDTGQTWQADTVGYNTGQQLFSVTTDTFQNALIAAAAGVYKQAPAATTWTLTSFPLQPAKFVFADRRNRIWAAGTDASFYTWIYHSTDDGATWAIDTVGYSRSGPAVIGMADDALGNVYVIAQDYASMSAGNKLYKSAGGTGPWTRIDQGIMAYNALSADSGIINSIAGDSSQLIAATNVGPFSSADGGLTWAPINGIQSVYCYGITETNDGHLLITNDLGCFTSTPLDSVWNKVYPDSGFGGGQAIWRDDAGTIYTGKSVANPRANIEGPYFNVKSTDNGHTWTPDTAGHSQVTQYTWWVDESGNEYAGAFGVNWTKPAAGSWAIDTTGVVYNPGYDFGDAFGSDHNGTVYYAVYSGNVFSRPIGGGTWTTESGIGGDAVYRFAHTSNHIMIGGGTSNIHYKTTGSWQDMPINSPAPQGTSPFIVAVDDSDYVWAAFSHLGSSGLYQGDGVFYTPDMGAHWYVPQGQATFVTFRWLIPVGDSVFGVSYGNGIYIFKRGGVNTGIRQINALHSLDLYPNPATTECRVIIGGMDAGPDASLVLYDALGHEAMKIPVNASQTEVSFSTAGLVSGTYYCTLWSGGKITGTQKLVIE